MKKLLTALISLVIFQNATAQGPNIVWQKSLGGSATDVAQSVQQTSDGGYIVAGQSYSINDQVSGHHSTSSNVDYWVVKLDDTGAIQWETSLGGTADDLGYSVQQTLDGGYIVAGAAESTDGDLSTCGIIEYDYWLVKLSGTGSIVWKNCFGSHGGAAFNKAYSVQQTPDSNYIVAGFTNSADSGEVSGYHGNSDYWVIKVSSSGGFMWGKCLGGSGNDNANCVRYTADGGYIVCGQSGSNDGQVTGHKGSVGIPDYWVVKLNDTGAVQWEKSLGGSGTDQAYTIRQTYDGGYIVAGNSNSADSQVTGNHGGYDMWVVKLNDTGAIQWEESLGGAGDDWATSVIQTADSGYVIAGYSDSSSGQVTGTHGGNDYWIVKLSKTGNLVWQKAIGGSGTDEAYSVQATNDSGFIVAGGSNSTDGQVTGNHGAYDYWVVKLSQCYLTAPVTLVQTGLVLSTLLHYKSYKWEKNGVAIAGATNATYSITSNGSYTVFVIDSNSCEGTSTVFIETGVQTIYNNQTIALNPNPTTGIVNITGAGTLTIRVYNTLGQLMKEARNATTISLAGLPSQLYFIKLTDDHGMVVYEGKVLKQ